jgi:CheY-like chemotaxis protein
MSTILVVEDTEADRMIVVTLLRAEGHTVLQAIDGQAGLEYLRKEHPDLVIIDVNVPGMNGLSVIQEMRADSSISKIPVIFCTAWYDEYATEKAIRSLGYPVISKPISFEHLVRTVDTVLGLK